MSRLRNFRRDTGKTYLQHLATGRNEAAAERYRYFCRAVGNLPPTPGELERIIADGPPDGWVSPKTQDKGVWQLPNRESPRGRSR